MLQLSVKWVTLTFLLFLHSWPMSNVETIFLKSCAEGKTEFERKRVVGLLVLSRIVRCKNLIHGTDLELSRSLAGPGLMAETGCSGQFLIQWQSWGKDVVQQCILQGSTCKVFFCPLGCSKYFLEVITDYFCHASTSTVVVFFWGVVILDQWLFSSGLSQCWPSEFQQHLINTACLIPGTVAECLLSLGRNDCRSLSCWYLCAIVNRVARPQTVVVPSLIETWPFQALKHVHCRQVFCLYYIALEDLTSFHWGHLAICPLLYTFHCLYVFLLVRFPNR